MLAPVKMVRQDFSFHRFHDICVFVIGGFFLVEIPEEDGAREAVIFLTFFPLLFLVWMNVDVVMFVFAFAYYRQATFCCFLRFFPPSRNFI